MRSQSSRVVYFAMVGTGDVAQYIVLVDGDHRVIVLNLRKKFLRRFQLDPD